MAFIAAGMSIGLALLVYFMFFQDVFSDAMALLVLIVMLAMTAISSVVALNNVRKKIICPQCGQHFFATVTAMFTTPKYCAACKKTPNHGNRS